MASLFSDDAIVSKHRTVYSFGQNVYGELFVGGTEEKHAPTLVDFCNDLNIVQIVAGNEHTAMLADDGEVYTCGYNESGQCGVGEFTRASTPQKVVALSGKNIVAIFSANGCEHLCSVGEDGVLYICGHNARGQLGIGNTAPLSIPKPVEALFGRRVLTVTCSYFHTIATTDHDYVFAWGRNDAGQLGLNDTTDRLVPQQVVALAGRRVVSLGCGQYHSAFVLGNGEVHATGKNDYGQLGIPGSSFLVTPAKVTFTLTDKMCVQVACGYYHTTVLTAEGRLFTFGRNDFGQLGLGHRENQVKAKQVETLSSIFIRQISCGCYHSVALGDNGRVYPFGRNNHGQLGTNNTVDSVLPTVIESLRGSHVTQIAAGFYHTVCLAGAPIEASARVATRSLASDLRPLLNNSSYSDITFIVEGKAIYAHRCLVIARCEPLAVMLTGPMRESTMTDINIPEQKYAVFLALLEFLYTDSVKALVNGVDIAFALDLLATADQFLVEKLKRLAEAAIESSISPDNVADMFKVAARRGAMELRRKCLDFILRNFGHVIGTTAFIDLPHELLQEVLFTASKRGVYIRTSSSSDF